MNSLTNMDRITSVELAEYASKQHSHVMRDIRNMEPAWEKVNGSKFGLVYYVDAKGQKRPMYNLTKEESLYVVSKYNDEVRAKLIKRWRELEQPKSQAEIALMHAQALVDQERKIKQHDDRLRLLEAKTTTRPEYFTVAGYASLRGVPVDVKGASRYGRRASAICKRKGLPVDTTPDPRFGKVNMYPREVLDEVFAQG